MDLNTPLQKQPRSSKNSNYIRNWSWYYDS